MDVPFPAQTFFLSAQHKLRSQAAWFCGLALPFTVQAQANRLTSLCLRGLIYKMELARVVLGSSTFGTAI